MKHLQYGIVVLLSMVAISSMAQKQNPAYLTYIDQWKETAIQNQADYGIPASIIMAQALLESSAGQSELALNANNHFGIKCTNEWFGGVYYYDDDSKGECFRQYNNAAESFKDHALFLQRPRYATCFEIVVEDYEGWAYRLKQCGYATDPGYAPKLIRLIEDYRLDTMVAVSHQPSAVSSQPSAVSNQPSEGSQKPLKAEVVRKGETYVIDNSAPEEPPYVEPLSARKEKQLFLLTHPTQKCNGVKYVQAKEDDTYATIAFRINVRERLLREWNDALGRELAVGDRVYLSAKKKKVEEEKTIMWVHPGEKLWDICQREGIQMKQVQKLNGFTPALRTFHTRQKIYLNKVKEK